MRQIMKRCFAFLIAFIFAVTGAFVFNGTGTFVYADVTSVGDEDQDTSYPKGGGVLGAIGVDTSEMPETYDADNTDNPYGSDVINLSEMNELVKIDTSNSDSKLFGHNCKLDGSYDTLVANGTSKTQPVSGPGSNGFIAATNCDVNGSGRDSAVAMVYTDYRYSSTVPNESGKIYMTIYDPMTGESTEPLEICSVDAFVNSEVRWNYLVQSQLQIAAGDFDNDTVEEIAVYVPVSNGAPPKIRIFDLTQGVDCANPFNNSSWQEAWNYILPKTNAKVIQCDAPPGSAGTDVYYVSNFYNNVDLKAADADNDGSCDLVVSYGASDVFDDGLTKQAIVRSLPSRAVMLYGSNGDDAHGSQMLRDSQELDLGDDNLIRVAFGFGDLDGDGNEDMVMGGQLQDEQSNNISRVLGKFDYDSSNGGMFCEGVQKMEVICGQWTEKEVNGNKIQTFTSGNGWDGYYHSMPAMNTNIAVGKIYGQDNDTRIYMDSVLYSYDSTFAVVDELEDPSRVDPDDEHSAHKGSAVFTDMSGLVAGHWKQLDYYEYGACIGNYTASAEDYILVHRVSQKYQNPDSNNRYETDASVLVPFVDEKDDDKYSLSLKSNRQEVFNEMSAGPVTLLTADTDIDSCVAKYTGKHEITYQKPKVLAVIASAPYFKDVADYDGGDMLSGSVTSYGQSSGSEDGFSQNLEIHAGIYNNNDISIGTADWGLCNLVGMNIAFDTGLQYTRESGTSASKEFEVTYGATAGEDQVVLFSTPTENFTYEVTTGAVDDDGNVSISKFMQTNANPHQPVTQVIPLDNYKEIQKRYSEELPDVTQYLTSKPGDPKSYPKDEGDLPKKVIDSWKDVSKAEYFLYVDKDGKIKIDYDHWLLLSKQFGIGLDLMEKEDYTWFKKGTWEGAGFGNGFITQTLSAGATDFKRKGYGGYFDLEVGAHFKQQAGIGLAEDYEADVGAQFAVSGDEGMTYTHTSGITCSGTVANMPRSAEGYGYDFSWNLLEYSVHHSKECVFPVVTYMVTDVQSPPKLPDSITQNFDETTDSQVCMNWTYTAKEPKAFDVYRYKDFPQGGGDELVGTVDGDDFTIRKDADGNTITDSDGKPIKEYKFIERWLTADTKYNYRLKVRGNSNPSESIFSPVIELRTDVSEKPALNLSADKLKIYPDGQYLLSVELADPEHYEASIDYQWQVYSKETRSWQDLSGRDKRTLKFSNCKAADAGQYRCRVNLVRKHEGSPQYISAYTGACEVTYSLRDVEFDPISVFEGTGSSVTNTGASVGVNNSSSSSTSKPTGEVEFNFAGPNGDFAFNVPIDEETGIAKIDSIEDELGSQAQEAFVNGGYAVTVKYLGDYIFNSAEDEEEYHYLRKIQECDFLSMQSAYYFGQNIIPTTNLFKYTEKEGGVIHREDITEEMTAIKLYAANADGTKGDLVTSIDLSEANGIVKIPLNTKLKKRAYVEAYTSDASTPVAHQVIRTAPKKVNLYLEGKISGGGNLLKLYSFDDVTIVGDCDVKEKNIIDNGEDPQSLEDLFVFKYYQDNGDYMFDSTQAEDHKADFIPARYHVDLAAKDNASKKLYETFYDFNNPAKAEYLVVGSYYEVTAEAADPGTGSVSMISPVLLSEVNKVGFSGGSKITLKAQPAQGFRIRKWTIEDGQGGTQSQSGGDLLTYTLRSDPTLNSDGQVKITAVFEPKNQTLTYEAKGKGEVTVDPSFDSGSTILEGTQLTFKAEADEGWHFKEWRWENYGGNASISAGDTAPDGTNSKTYTMGDTAAAVYAVFFKDTIDIDLDEHLTASYINDGSNPLEDIDKEIEVNKGKEVPKGTTVRVLTAPGYEPAENAEWIVNVTTPDGTSQIDVREYNSGNREGCEFDLPDDVIGCSVQFDTIKGHYSLGLEGDNVKYIVSLDGTRIPESQYEQRLSRIEVGTLVEVQAVPDRGKLFDKWLIDGDENEDAPQDYSFTMKDSVTLEAKVMDDTEYTVKLQAANSGTGQYTITGHNGEEVTGTFGRQEVEVTAYKGESISICGDPNDRGHILTAVKMNGERQDLADGVFTLESIQGDTEFVCSFQPTTYCTVNFQNDITDTTVQVLDSNGDEIDISEPVEVGSGEDLSFSVVLDRHHFCFVRGESLIDPVNQHTEGDNTKYDYSVRIEKNTTLTISNDRDWEIKNLTDLNEFMLYNNQLNEWGLKERIKGTVKADIIIGEGESITQGTGAFQGTLDGNGHKISGWKLNGGVNEDNVLQPYDGRSFLFEAIAPGGAVKDLIIEDFDAYVKEYGLGSEYGNALLTGENNGRISGVTLKGCSLSQLAPQTAPPLNKPELAGIAVTNTGKIEACQVIGLKLQAGRDEQISNLVGCAVALKNHLASEKGEITACYVEGLQTSGSYHHGDGFEDAKAPIIADDMVEQGSGPFTGNYFRTYNAGPETDGPRGTNITAITNDPDKPAFAANLAYHMNHEASELWGIYRPAEAADDGEIVTPKITPLSYGGEDCKAPVMAEFKYGDTDYKTYVYPGPCKLPGNENFGEDLAFWQLGEEGTVVYSIGYEFVDVLTDTLFVGVASPEGCVAELYGEDNEGNKTGITCYKDLNDALEAAAATELENPHLDIVGDCAMDSGTFTVKANMVMTVCDGAAFTMKKPAAINNKGTFTCAEGATFHKRGTMNNTGTINVDGIFWNYGSKLTNSSEGTIKNRTDIKCKPHLMGEWQSAAQPNEDGTWTNTATCEVCTNTIEEKVDPNPEADAIDYIEVYRYPTKAEYQTGDNFDTRGLMISAVLKSGLRAKITGYNMTISDGTSEPAVIVDGDVLNKRGAMQITVNYEGFTCGFPIIVRSPITGIAIADGEREVAVNEHLQLETIITPEGVQADIQWTSDNETVATVDENGLVTGHAGGQAKITASVDDMNASVTITVHEAATSLELDAYEILVPKDGNGLIAARVAPATADGEVTWTASDPSVAGIIVTDPQTGETSVVDSATTKLSQGNASEASSYIAVAGVEEGQATITASVKDARGLTIHKDCTVDVSQSDSSVRILYDGLVVSGKTVTVDASEETIYMRAESSEENDTIDWNSIDDIEDPVISVNDNGTIDLIRSGSAVVQVTSDKTGISDYCILNVVRMPASITLSTNDLYMAKGTVKMLTATMSPEKVDGSVKWSTSDESVAKVTNGGVITGEGEGVAIITAQSTADPDVMANCQVTVFERELKMTLDKDSFYYDGKDKVPHITITSGSQILAENITESNDRVMLVFKGSVRGPGKHNVTAIGRDEGMGMATASYKIIIKPTKVRKLVGESKAITVKWKKKKRGVITGYQVQIATDTAFTKNKKTKKIKKAKINNVTFKNLKAKKKYYVRMRSYKKIGATSYYSKWSEIKTVKTKK